jgi:uncharacterized protein with PIN domain
MINGTESPIYCQKYLDKISEISIDNKYTKWYLKLCQKAALRDHPAKVDMHHILPFCFDLGGESDSDNLAHLSLREHFVCHLLLTRMMTGTRRYQMLAAAFLMANRVKSSRAYEYLRIQRDKEHGPRHSVKLTESHRNNPEIQVRRKVTLASKPTLTCPKCYRNFRYPDHLLPGKHICRIKNEKAARTHRELGSGNMNRLRETMAGYTQDLECCHCKRTFKLPWRWRKHVGCVGN